MSSEKHFAMICAANCNRSVAAHALLLQEGFRVASFGAADTIKLPGPSVDKPNRYHFGEATYASMLQDLITKDKALYERNGLTTMMERNMKVKPAPQRWQDWEGGEPFDVVVTFEKRVMDAVVNHLHSKEDAMHPTLVINLEVRDSVTDAAAAAPMALQLCKMIEEVEDWEDEIEEIKKRFEEQSTLQMSYTVCFS